MKWITHQAAVLVGAVWLQTEPILTSGLLLGAVLPDMAEQAVARKDQKLFFKIHRGFLHWFGLYFLLLGLLFWVNMNPTELLFCQGLMLGALAHLALDALNPSGIPLLPFAKKPSFGYNLVSTGSFNEWVFLGFIFCLLALGGYHINQSWLNKFIHFFQQFLT